MPRYLVERTFPDGLNIPINDEGAATCLTADPESIRKAATRNGLPVDAIREVGVLDPYFYS